ncbi:MAG: hypothetical protein RLZZ450_1194 [Pseudomonadota bacterium]
MAALESNWRKVNGAEAIVDRLMERGRAFQLDGPSIRSRHVDPAALDGGVPPAIVFGTDLTHQAPRR